MDEKKLTILSLGSRYLISQFLIAKELILQWDISSERKYPLGKHILLLDKLCLAMSHLIGISS